MILHINIKNQSKLRSGDFRLKKDMKSSFFRDLLKKLISFIYCKNAVKVPYSAFNSGVHFIKLSRDIKIFKLCKGTIVTKTLNA